MGFGFNRFNWRKMYWIYNKIFYNGTRSKKIKGNIIWSIWWNQPQLLRENKETEIPIHITFENLDNIYLTKYNKIKEKYIHSNPEIGIINGLG